MQRSMWICFLCLCALSNSARVQQQKLTKMFPLGVESYSEVRGCFKALGLEAAEVSLETFAPSFQAAMKNPEPKEDPDFSGGTRGACLSMFAIAKWEDSDDLATHGGPYVAAIADDVINGECDDDIIEKGVRALGKMYPFLDNGNKAVVLTKLINVLKEFGEPVWAAGAELKKILPTLLPSIPSDLLPALKIAAAKAKQNNSFRAMLGVVWAMQGVKTPLGFKQVKDIVMAASEEHKSDDYNYFASVAEDMAEEIPRSKEGRQDAPKSAPSWPSWPPSWPSWAHLGAKLANLGK